jgi:hypothetical protein
VSVEPNSIEAFFEAIKNHLRESLLLETVVLFGFTLTFGRVLSVLKSGYPAEYT